MLSSGRSLAKPGSPCITVLTVTDGWHSRRQSERSKSSGAFPSSRSLTYPPLTSSCAGRALASRKARTNESTSFSLCGTELTISAGRSWA
eukprot:scaffold104820_cov32-Tisochrysis_lutea.AAC.1